MILNWLINPLSFAFMQRGLAAALLVGLLCSIIGCFVVLRGMAFMGDALAHAILPGVAIAYLLKGNLLVGALIAAMVVALSIGFLSRRSAIKEDTAIGILFSAALALGVALISSIRTYATDLSHILFGNILGVTAGDLAFIAIVAATVLLVVLVLYRPFLIHTFDPILASTMRLPVNLLQNLMLLLIALAVVVSLQTVGIGLVAALLVTPPATAYLISRRLPVMILYSALFGVLSSIFGLYLSYYINIASGPAIVLVATLIFVLVFLFNSRNGLLARRIKSIATGPIP
ncbi:MAG: metal ABC transporter permease [Anaerolineaceae bacterium]